MFVFVTGEEAGLLGSDYFAHHPTVRRGQIVANLNIDGGSLTPVDDVIAWGAEHSTLGAAVDTAARQTGFRSAPIPFPRKASFRSDQFSFVKQGVPLMIDLRVHSTMPGVDALAVSKKWLVTTYHSPKDRPLSPFDMRLAHVSRALP